MAMPELKLPEEGAPIYSYDDFIRGNVPDGSFAYTFFDTYKKYDHDLFERMKRKVSRSISYGKIDIYDFCSAHNEYSNEMRSRIDRELQKYMIDHGGVIDAYPYPVISYVVQASSVVRTYNEIDEDYDKEEFEGDNFDVVYDHFGTDCEVLNGKLERGQRKARTVRLYLQDEFTKLIDEEKVLKALLVEAKNQPKEKFKSFLCNIPAYLTVGVSVLLFLSFLFGWDGIEKTVGGLIPYYLDVAEVNGYSLIHFVALIFAGCFVTAVLRSAYEPKVDYRVGTVAERQKEYDEFIKAHDFKALELKASEYRYKYNECASKWHSEWFRATGI